MGLRCRRVGEPRWAARIEKKLEHLMTTVNEALAGWRAYSDSLKAHIGELESALSAANSTVQQLKDTDAAEDAAQAQALTEQIAQQIADALAAAQNPPAPPADATEPADDSTEVPPTGGGIDPGLPSPGDVGTASP